MNESKNPKRNKQMVCEQAFKKIIQQFELTLDVLFYQRVIIITPWFYPIYKSSFVSISSLQAAFI